MMPKKELIRIVRTPEDAVLIDLTGKKIGTGSVFMRQSFLLQAGTQK